MSLLSHDESSSDELVEVEVEDSVLKKGPWTSEEDEILAAYVTKHGVGNWNAVRKNTGLARCGKSCRLRWSNHLKPDLKKGAFSAEEQRKIIELHALMGNKWARMAQELPGRTDNEIKNFWNTRQKKRKRAGLPLYPDDIKPALLNSDNQEDSLNGSTQQQAYDSQTDTSVPELIFNNYKLSQKHPLHIPPIPDITEHNTFDFEQGSDNPIVQTPKLLHDSDMPPALFDCMFQGDYMSGGYACSSDHLTITELPPFPSSFDDETLIEINPLIEHTQYYEPVCPRSSELLESMFYPPKILEGSHHFSNHPCETQRVPNPEKKENFNMHRDPTNPNDLPEFRWFENYDKDQSAIQDTLFSVIQPYVNRKTSS